MFNVYFATFKAYSILMFMKFSLYLKCIKMCFIFHACFGCSKIESVTFISKYMAAISNRIILTLEIYVSFPIYLQSIDQKKIANITRKKREYINYD